MGGIYKSIAIREQDAIQDPEASLAWYRRAAESAEPGSVHREKALINIGQFLIVGSPEEAEVVLQQVLEEGPTNLTAWGRVWNLLAQISWQAGERDVAERYVRQILEVHLDPPMALPEDPMEKATFDMRRRGAIAWLVEAWRQTDKPYEERLERIRALRHDFPFVARLWLDSTRAIEWLEEQIEEQETRG